MNLYSKILFSLFLSLLFLCWSFGLGFKWGEDKGRKDMHEEIENQMNKIDERVKGYYNES